MADGSKKKRRTSASPPRAMAAKRPRQAPDNVPNAANHAPSSRASSIFQGNNDPYHPARQTPSSTSLPASDDWDFRIKVISSTTALHNHVFEKAVQGLVKICFPQQILHELGLDVLQRHMREENAPEANVQKMIQVYKAEMIRRVTWMLAEYLDTPDKVETCAKSVVEASSSLHAQVGHSLFAKIATSLAAQGACDQTSAAPSADTPFQILTTIEKEVEMQSQSSLPTDDTIASSGWCPGPGEELVDAEEPFFPWDLPRLNKQSDLSNKNITPTWRWDVDPDGLSSEAMIHAFKRPSDLFAFHALPIARDRLTQGSSRKEVRYKIKDMLREMPDAEFEKWVESFQKLHRGDDTMLIRIPLEPVLAGQRAFGTTPAPVSRQKYQSSKTKALQGKDRASVRSVPGRKLPPNDSRPKTEVIDSASNQVDHQLGNETPKDDVLQTTVAFRRLSTENPDTVAAVHSPSRLHNSPPPNSAQVAIRPRPTPITDLLKGCTLLSNEPHGEVVQTIMNNLTERVPADFIGIPRLDGSIGTQSKIQLQGVLNGLINKKQGLQHAIESELAPWIVAKLDRFPELKTEPLVFVNTMICSTVVLDCFIGQNISVSPSRKLNIKDAIIEGLLLRLKYHSTHPYIMQLGREIMEIPYGKACKTSRDAQCRGRIEMILRQVAFDHKDKFQDLKFSAPVKAWERLTGSNW